VASEEQNNKKNEGKGFAGLSNLVSDVDTTPPPPAPKTESAGSTTSTGRPASQAAQPQSQQPTQRQTYQEPPQSSSGSSGGKWVVGIAVVVGLLWLIGQSDKNTPSPAPAYSPPAQSAAPSYSPPAQPQAPSVPQESKPPVGQDLVFSTAQIRYCLAEDIRMDAAKSVLNNYSDSDVNRFNAMVADYNSRCGSFRYRSGALESARRDVEPYRSQLQAEGRSRFARSPSTGSLSAPAPMRPTPDATIQAIQRHLNELGYDAGPADGLVGARTRAAIASFQRNIGVQADGVANTELLRQLRSHGTTGSAASSPNSPRSNSQRPATNEAVQITTEERQSIEMVCLSDKVNNGPAAYNKCLQSHLASLGGTSRRPNLSRLSTGQRQSVEMACLSEKVNSGPAAYNRCLTLQLSRLGN